MRHARRVLRLATVAVAAATAAGCELVETCDPELDPTCVVVDDTGDTGGTTDTGGTDTGGTGCGTLGEGQTRCVGSSSMEECVGGQTRTVACDGGCSGNACADAVRYVRIVDLTPSISGQHPGADIDAIELRSGGQTYYAARVSDWFIDTSISSQAPDVTECLGPPDQGGATCDLTTGAEHWVSLAGGELVVAFDGDRAIRSGDEITVYECSGAAQDRFDITIGTSSRLEGDWTTLLEEASGTISVRVP
ncbi:MAG: hypothetical protein H6698_01855 [Myxococcales bacterium]|nr:hypothetical protein [Myxococcales bacterium]MCB9533055.1 hypothetical protein [Myxococcales bacterium]